MEYNTHDAKQLAALEEEYKRKLLALSRRAEPPAAAAAGKNGETGETREKKETVSERRPEKPAAANLPDTGQMPVPNRQDIPMVSEYITSRAAPLPSFPAAAEADRGRTEKCLLPEKEPVLCPAPLVQSEQLPAGQLRARVTTGSGAVPVAGALVRIERKEGEGVCLVEQLLTDRSGNTALSAPLPTRPAESSQTPAPDRRPYTLYQVKIRAPGFAEYRLSEIPVFAGEISVIRADLLPVQERREEEI